MEIARKWESRRLADNLIIISTKNVKERTSIDPPSSRTNPRNCEVHKTWSHRFWGIIVHCWYNVSSKSLYVNLILDCHRPIQKNQKILKLKLYENKSDNYFLKYLSKLHIDSNLSDSIMNVNHNFQYDLYWHTIRKGCT